MLCPKDNITIAVIRGAKPGKTVGLRFDTDALQMQELCDVPYKSETDGLMHGCGHGAHTTCGVFVARLLKAHADALCGTYKIIFQPAEEGEHGADEVIATGLVSDVDAFYGLHVWSLYPTGTLHATPGGIWAEPDMFKVTIHGKGGHGATPEVCVDAITAGAAVVQSLSKPSSPASSPRWTAWWSPSAPSTRARAATSSRRTRCWKARCARLTTTCTAACSSPSGASSPT